MVPPWAAHQESRCAIGSSRFGSALRLSRTLLLIPFFEKLIEHRKHRGLQHDCYAADQRPGAEHSVHHSFPFRICWSTSVCTTSIVRLSLVILPHANWLKARARIPIRITLCLRFIPCLHLQDFRQVGEERGASYTFLIANVPVDCGPGAEDVNLALGSRFGGVNPLPGHHVRV